MVGSRRSHTWDLGGTAVALAGLLVVSAVSAETAITSVEIAGSGILSIGAESSDAEIDDTVNTLVKSESLTKPDWIAVSAPSPTPESGMEFLTAPAEAETSNYGVDQAPKTASAQFDPFLLDGVPLQAGETLILRPGIDVEAWDRLHFNVSGGTTSIPDLRVYVEFGTPRPSGYNLVQSVVWFEGGNPEVLRFEYTTPSPYFQSGFVLSVPVIAPVLFNVVLENLGSTPTPPLYVTLMPQEY